MKLVNRLSPSERLVVSADFRPNFKYGQGKSWVRHQIINLAHELRETRIHIKINSGLRSLGYDLIGDIQLLGLRVFADLKLNDISETLSTDAILIREAGPEILTVMCNTSVSGMRAIKSFLPDTEVLGVTVLTSFNVADTRQIYHSTIDSAVSNLAIQAKHAKLNGIVCSAKEISLIKSVAPQLSVNTPGIRPTWAPVQGDDQDPERVMTPTEAIKAGVDRIIVGRPILQAKNRREAVMKILEEINSALK